MKPVSLMVVVSFFGSVACGSPEGARGPGPSSSASASTQVSALACTKDEDCGWDEPCVPTKCIQGGKRRSQHVECEESAPDPGVCACVRGACTLRPK